MLKQTWQKSLVFLLAINLMFSPVLNAAQLSLPAGDTVAPVVKHEKFSDYVVKGQNYSIEATVTDNVEVKTVVLFYRISGSNTYKYSYMEKVKGTQNYVVTLNKSFLVPPGIEYYIKATDTAGNSLLHGYSFAPLTVEVSNQVKQIVNMPIKKAPSEDDSDSNTWLWIGLGILAVAAAGAASSGGGSSSSAAPVNDSTVVVTAPLPF